MDKFDKRKKVNNKGNGLITFPVPFLSGEIIENIIVTSNIASSYSKELIINKALKLHSKGKILEALKYYQSCISKDFNDHRVFSNYGVILKALGKLKEAEISTRKAIKLKADFADAYSNLALILIDLENIKEAESSIRKAIKLKPDFAGAYYNLGYILRKMGKYDEAINCYKKALKLNSSLSCAKTSLIESKKDICDWSDEETHFTWLKTLGIKGASVLPFCFLFLEDNPVKHLNRSQKFYKENFIEKTYPLNILKNKKIHIGYFSADFNRHATMHLIASIFELHDKLEFEIYLYSFTPQEDEYTTRAKKSGCIFRDIKNMSIIESVELARSDNLDIAIDLKGYTKHNRMNIFAYRVAPIQVNYLGYPGSLGAKSIDYIIADKTIIPEGYEKFYSEKIIYMPNCYQCNDDKKEIYSGNIDRREFNLPDKGFVFSCFNANRKISSKEFDIWMRLLTKIKGSVLWLYQSNPWAVKNLCKEAEIRKVDPNRLIFANQIPLNKHLARHSLGDLGLDTFNYNGHTTTSDALWAGLPVLTKEGESFAARVSSSLLTALGLTELITYSEREYEEKAIYIASNHDILIRIKTKLAKSRKESTLFNSELYTKNLEIIFKNLIEPV
tara:strand:- start:40 stop:1887 length:1848 start_codon:yes stop_codon:yes gene_type:complete